MIAKSVDFGMKTADFTDFENHEFQEKTHGFWKLQIPQKTAKSAKNRKNRGFLCGTKDHLTKKITPTFVLWTI